jgi:hypothetical protein
MPVALVADSDSRACLFGKSLPSSAKLVDLTSGDVLSGQALIGEALK